MTKYGKKAGETVENAVHDYKRGQLKMGRSGKTVKSRQQAIAIGLSEAREAGGKVPPEPKRSRAKRSRPAAKRNTTAHHRASDGM